MPPPGHATYCRSTSHRRKLLRPAPGSRLANRSGGLPGDRRRAVNLPRPRGVPPRAAPEGSPWRGRRHVKPCESSVLLRLPSSSCRQCTNDAQRRNGTKYVFPVRNRRRGRLHTSAWKRAWTKAGLPVDETVLKGVHNLRHTFGRRLRAAGVPIETRKLLMGHANGDITTHYSAAELGELLSAAEKVTDRGIAQTPALTLIRRHAQGVGKMSELKEKLREGSAA